MQFKIDENLPVEAADLFRAAGYEAQTVYGEHLVGRPDPVLADVCRAEKRALVTLDLDFADISAYPPEHFHGLIVLRPRLQARANVLNLLGSVMTILKQESLAGRLWIVDESKIRIREGKADDETSGE